MNHDIYSPDSFFTSGAIAGVAAVMITVLAVSLVLTAIVYVFQAIGLYTIAKRRGIKHAWLAWIPVADYWIVGCISDQYQFVTRNNVRSRRKLLLVLAIITVIVSIVLLCLCGNFLVSILVNIDSLETMSDSAFLDMFLTPLLSMSGLSIVTSVLAIVMMVFTYMALYDIFRSCDPSTGVVFLVLSILFSITPFFLFADRNKDRGMPPRRDQIPPEQPTWQPTPPRQDPWSQNPQ